MNSRRLVLRVMVGLLGILGPRAAVMAQDNKPEPARAIARAREGLQNLMVELDSRPDWLTVKRGIPSPSSRDEARAAWTSFLDHILALDAVGQTFEGFKNLSKRQDRAAFYYSYASFLASYRFALEWIDRVEKNPLLDTILNDVEREGDIDGRLYRKFKFRFLNVARAAEFFALQALDTGMRDSAPPPVRSSIMEDRKRIWDLGKIRGQELTFKNALKVIQNAGVTAWFPVQAGVAEWMGNVKVKRKGEYLIDKATAERLAGRLRPGDILLTRREWYLTNLGIPGYWTHAALYVGTPKEREEFFADPASLAWVRGQKAKSRGINDLIKEPRPERKALSNHPLDKGHFPRVLEAIGDGVVFSTLGSAAGADSVAVLRPRVDKTDLAKAVVRAFGYAGRPYDYDFDFLTDSKLVCSELIYKAFQPDKGASGLNLPLETVMGKQLLPPNKMAVLFDSQWDRDDRLFDFVAFLDGYEQSPNKIVEKGPQDLRTSWTRPKWHILLKE